MTHTTVKNLTVVSITRASIKLVGYANVLWPANVSSPIGNHDFVPVASILSIATASTGAVYQAQFFANIELIGVESLSVGTATPGN